LTYNDKKPLMMVVTIGAIVVLTAGLIISNTAYLKPTVALSQDNNATTANPLSSSNETTIISDVNLTGTTIKIAGEASKRIEPDQVTIVLAIQTKPVDAASIIDIQQQSAKKVMDTVKAVADANNSSLTVTEGTTTLNPQYSGDSLPLSPDTEFIAHASLPITIGIDQLSEIAQKMTNAGFAIEDLHSSYGASPYAGIPYPGLSFEYGRSMQQESDTNNSNIMTQFDNSTIAANQTEFQVNLSIAISTKPDTLQNVVHNYKAKFENLTKILEDSGIPSETTHQPVEVSIEPLFNGVGQQQNSSYESYTQFIVRTDAANIESVVQAAQKQGAYAENIFLSISDSQIDEARKELSRLAFENAKDRANEMAQSLGLQVKEVRSIEVNMNSLPTQYGGIAAAYRGVNFVQPDGNFPDAQGGGEVSVSVVAEFELG